MSTQESSSVEIYIGSRIEHASERAVLESLLPALMQRKRDALALANFNLNGRQIDLVLALNDLTLLIEAKGYTRPVSGGLNGSWHVALASGRSRNVVNGYLQALIAKNALRDAMRAFASSDVNYYPNAAVVFVPDIPARSSLPSGDHKVSLIGLPALGGEIQRKQLGCWSISEWRAFACHHNLARAASIASACDPALLRGERIVSAYLAEFHRTYAPHAEAMIDFKCVQEGLEVRSIEIAQRVASGCDALITGPSGCGKTLLAFSSGVAFAKNHGVPIAISAKHFEGSFKALLDREVGLMAPCSAADLLRIARQLNVPTLLIVDGYNECEDVQRVALTRGIAAISSRFQMGVLITSQFIPTRNDLLPQLPQYSVPATEREVKIAIASKTLMGAAPTAGMEKLIDSVASGLEAALVGEVGLEAESGVSRYGLFDAYARKRLGAFASDGVRALSILAGWLTDHVALSLSVRDLDRLSEAQQLSATLLPSLVSAGLLASRGDRMSFGHEQFFYSFAAESVIRRAFGSTDAIVLALRSPRYSELKEFIVGAIDDDYLLMQVLDQLSDSKILAACLSGRCGASARDWAERQMSSVVTRLRYEAQGVRFTVTGDTWFAASFDQEHLLSWTAQDDAFVDCLPQLLTEGRYLDEVFASVAAFDRRIGEEIDRLRRQDSPPKNLRSSIFAICYGLGGRESARLSRVCVAAHSHLFGTPEPSVIRHLHRIRDQSLSAGGLYLLISLYRQFPGSSRSSSDASEIASFYTSVITKQWRALPYHLKLAVVDGAGYCRNAEEHELAALVQALESLLSNEDIIFNSMVFDVLQMLRPFSSEELTHEDVVRNQLNQLLSAAADQDACDEAYAVYNCQFDHPYSNAYCEVLNSLSDQQRASFLKLAVKGARDVSLFLSCLIREVAALKDPSVIPELTRWTVLPRRDHFSPQEAIEVFALTHVVLGRLGGELPLAVSIAADDAAAQSLRACATILYWCNRNDIAESARHQACEAHWEVLNHYGARTALSAVKDCADFMMRGSSAGHGETSLVNYFPSRVAELCRDALKRADEQTGYFPRHSFGRDSIDVLLYAIRILSVHGSTLDLPLLRQFVDHTELGRGAISAIHTITETR